MNNDVDPSRIPLDTSHIPPTRALVAFEMTARAGSLSEAAKEMQSSQPAMSRLIAALEEQLSVLLFERTTTGVLLTEVGHFFRGHATQGLVMIQTAAVQARRWSHEEVVIACSNENSYFILRPRYGALSDAAGAGVRVYILTYNYDRRQLPPTPLPDIELSWERSLGERQRVVMFEEAVRPVCSPAYAAAHADVLRGPVKGWLDLTFLDHQRPNEGWMTWSEWFGVAGAPDLGPEEVVLLPGHDYVLDAAADGQGLALGWRRYYEDWRDRGDLVDLGEGFVSVSNRCCAALTEKGLSSAAARRCLQFLEGLE